MKVQIKPLSVNDAYRGRRFQSKDYICYCTDLLRLLPKMVIPEGPLQIKLVFGLSNKASDIDNPVKPFVDVLQKAYGFNDKMIYKLDVEKKIVKKGEEFIDFVLSPHIA